MSLPNHSITEKADENLVPNKKTPRFDWHGPFSGQHVKPNAAIKTYHPVLIEEGVPGCTYSYAKYGRQKK